MSPTNGDGSGRSGATVRIVGTDGAEKRLDQSIGASHSSALLFLSSVVGNRFGLGSDGISFVSSLDDSNSGDGVAGRGFCVACGCRGTVLINDLNDLTGLSIPSSDGDDLLDCKSGDERK
jgi:hypothetical protein